MALDAATLALAALELEAALAGARIDKIYQPTRDEALFSMRMHGVCHRLLLSARLGSARICLTGENYENPQAPPSFCMLLRKHLTGGRLLSVTPLLGERIVFFNFLCHNEMGDAVYNTLAAELMGRYCNLVLVRKQNEGAITPQTLAQAGEKPPRILDALRRVSFEDSAIRQLLPGLAYTLPPRPPALDYLSEPLDALWRALLQNPAPVGDALRKLLGGVGPVIAREVCHRALGAAANTPAAALSAGQEARLKAAICDIRADWERGGVPTLVQAPSGAPVEFSFTPLTQYSPAYTLQRYASFSALLQGYYAEKDRTEHLRQHGKALRKTVASLYERAQRKQAARKQELADSGASEALRAMGELLTGNLHAFRKGDAAVTLQSWETGEALTIQLDARLGPSQNAQKYFKEYKKKQTAAKMLEKLLADGEREIEYLASVLYEIEAAPGVGALDEIRAELKGQGYLRAYKPRDKRQKPADFLRYRSADGFAILAGRNNAQNDRLTLKTARGKDLWFHVKNAPGSHVVVLSEGRSIPLATQNQAAMLAVWHSGQKNGVQVSVDYTQVKNIRKTAGLPPGMVLYEHYETAYVTPNAAELERLAATLQD